MSAYFVTAIGTDIGKTYVSAQMLKAWRGAGKKVAAVKTLMSGFGEADLPASDAGQLLQAMGQAVTPRAVSKICLHRFEAPLAPNVAMRQAGMVQDYAAILAFTRKALSAASPGDKVLVEGAGGVMSPVTDQRLHIDFMEDLSLPVILVAASYLGAVSHTLTAIAAIRARGLDLAALVASQPHPDAQDPHHLLREVGLFDPIPAIAVPYNGAAGTLCDMLDAL
ncbi:MAG: dethiobiotin synthase [Pseudomonadota bacterium]